MKRTYLLLCILSIIVIVGTSGITSVQNSGTPPTLKTGATGSYCNSCHGGNALNTAGGSVVSTGLPTAYSLNAAYTFSITITHAASNRKKWGFAMKAVNASGADIGTFTTTNTNASVGSGELRHSNAPTTAATNTYTFNNLKWTAPATNSLANKAVKFYLVAVAADGTGGSGADFVYSNLYTLPIATTITSFTPTKSSSGGSVSIKGYSFTGTTAVSFGGIAASTFTASTDTTITATVANGASGIVSVTSANGTGTLAGFTFCDPATVNNFVVSGCNSVVYNGKTYTSSTTVRDTLKNTYGCDSVYNIATINVQNITATTQSNNISGCDKVIYKTTTYTTSTVVKDTLKTTKGCDSVYVTNNITVNPSVSGNIIHPTKGAIASVTTMLTGTANSNTVSNGKYTASCLAANSNAIIKLSKNNGVAKANGVTTADVVLIQRHVLNLTKLTNAYKLIAADVTNDKNINSTDVIRVKRLILGLDTTFTGNRLWAFVDSAYHFPDTTNPFPYKDSISFTNLTSTKTNQTFIGVKLGDVNYDWSPAIARQFTANSLQLIADVKPENLYRVQNHIKVAITASNFKQLNSFQYTLHFDNNKYEFVNLEGFKNLQGLEWNATKVNETGDIAMLWTDAKGGETSLVDGSLLFSLVLKPKELGIENKELGLVLTNDITEIEAWDKDFNKQHIVLKTTNKEQATLNNEVFTVVPNPTSGWVKVSLVSNENKVVQFDLSNVYGKTVLQQNFEIVKGNNAYNINLHKNGKLPAGIYFLKAIGLNGENVKRIIIK